MAYRSMNGRRPDEQASKTMHSHIINDNAVKRFLNKCKFPPPADNVDVENLHNEVERQLDNPIQYVISIDGGFTETSVRDEFPSSNIAFFQFGSLCFEMADLDTATFEPFISPESIQKLRQIERYKLPLPTKNIIYEDCGSFTESFRTVLHQFCAEDKGKFSLNDTLRWIMYEEYRKGNEKQVWKLARCPHCEKRDVEMKYADVVKDNKTVCPECQGTIYLIDAFRLHEIVDEEMGARGVLGFITVALEQILMIAIIRYIFEVAPDMLRVTILIKDGPLAFFGQTANFQEPARAFFNYIRESGYPLYVVGAEKSGPFVEHAFQIKDKIQPGSYMILSNDYIYRYILPNNKTVQSTYGATTYYGNKIIFKNICGDLLVISLPTKQVTPDPVKDDFDDLDVVLTNLTKLKCNSFDSSLIPVAIVNKLVSLSNHPSADILQKFAKGNISKK